MSKALTSSGSKRRGAGTFQAQGVRVDVADFGAALDVLHQQEMVGQAFLHRSRKPLERLQQAMFDDVFPVVHHDQEGVEPVVLQLLDEQPEMILDDRFAGLPARGLGDVDVSLGETQGGVFGLAHFSEQAEDGVEGARETR